MENQSQMKIELIFKEYEKVKAEQIARIGFRDNLLYVTLTLFGGIVAAYSSLENHAVLLILPWVSLIMGWTYLINDEKISALGRYVRKTLTDQIAKELNIEDTTEKEQIFGWEIAHRSDARRKSRKILQLIIDEITFVVSGIGALIAFQVIATTAHLFVQILCVIEFFLLLILGREIFIYADLKKGR